MMRHNNARQTLRHKRGNALFLVLLGVALFAALSYTITDIGRSSSGDVSRERVGLLADEILLYAKQLERSVQMILANGYSEQDISFKHADLDAAYDHGGPEGAEVFNISGGGMRYKTFPQATSEDWIFTAENQVMGLGDFSEISGQHCPSGDFSECSELVAILLDIPLNLCLELNSKVGVSEASEGSPPEDRGSISIVPFSGVFYTETGIGDHHVGPKLTSRKRSACLEVGSTIINAPGKSSSTTAYNDKYYFYHVLLER